MCERTDVRCNQEKYKRHFWNPENSCRVKTCAFYFVSKCHSIGGLYHPNLTSSPRFVLRRQR